MTSLLTILGCFLAFTLALVVLPGTLLLLILTGASLFSPRKPDVAAPAGGRIGLIVPAHNEGWHIERTLYNLRAKAIADGNTDVIVIADNCSDNTADVARRCGVRVLERHDNVHRGKGYALDYAFSQLCDSKVAGDADYRYFLIVDADSILQPGFISALRKQFACGSEAIQCRYAVLNSADSLRTRLLEIEMCGFNLLRPRGRAALGWSVGLLGNGFAVRRDVVENIPYTAGSLVEDLEYHLVLTWHGVRVDFLEDAVVKAEMPVNAEHARSQRTRWEGGRFRMIREHLPSLLLQWLKGRSSAFEPMLELTLLPLSYQVSLLLILLLTPYWSLQVLGLAGLLVVAAHVLTAMWLGRLPLAYLMTLFFVPFYLIWKILLLPASLLNARSTAVWRRTRRNDLGT
ncbi:glycosyltransferase family 2 protein [Undibacterium squillarum]|uniref:Glycosyl transferase n=1 Tax=Undibacterium squillarum TaxID=1131567 RepID=A0ABQ2XVN4_9BURK|nr:glycosyltransferase family 2 protein [Undibacterium squillarum]GGX36477.1 glycosyl transferase [Undibacterium squillarum]